MKKVSVGLVCSLLLGMIVFAINAQDSGFTANAIVQQSYVTLGLAVSSDGSKLIVGSGLMMVEGHEGTPAGQNSIIIYDTETGEVIHEFGSTAVFVADVGLSADESHIIGALTPGKVGIWDVETGELVREYSGIMSARLAVSPDGQMVISNARLAHPVIWNFEDGEVLHTFEELTGIYGPVDFTPDGKIIAITTDVTEGETVIILWDTETMSELYRLDDIVTSTDLEFSPDGKFLAVATVDSGIQVFDVESGDIAYEFNEYQAPNDEISSQAVSVAFSSDGTQLLSSWAPTDIVLWDIETGVSTHIGSHEAPVWQVSFMPDGNFISSSYDGFVNMWVRNE